MFVKEHPGQASVALLPFNFFQSMENIVDYAHTYFVHQVGTEAALPRRTRAIPPLKVEETSFGFTEHMHHPDRPEGHPYKVSHIHFLMPNHCHIYESEMDSTPCSGTSPSTTRATCTSSRISTGAWGRPSVAGSAI